MKLLWVIPLLFIAFSTTADNKNADSSEKLIFIANYPSYLGGERKIYFTILESKGTIRVVRFKVNYIRSIAPRKHEYKTKKNQQVSINDTGIMRYNSYFGYTAIAYPKHLKILDSQVCEMLHPNFLQMTNVEKYQLLDSLSKKNYSRKRKKE